MVCHARSASVTSRRRPLPLPPPPVPLALLDLTKPGEREAHEYLTLATTGRVPHLRLLDVRLAGWLLVCAVVWVHSKEPAVLEINLADSAVLSLRIYRCFTTDLAIAALNRRCAATSQEGVRR